MTTHPSWSGLLKLSLVTCPVRLFNATTRAKTVSFHYIHRKTHNRIHMKPYDPELGEVDRKDLIRGYEIAKGKYVTVSEDDLAQIRLKSTKVIEIEKFVRFGEIDPLYLDGAYFVVPDGKTGEEAFSVIRDAMQQEERAAQGRLVLSYREHVVIIQPRGQGLVLHRMHDAREVEASPPEGGWPNVEVDEKMVKIASEIIHQNEGDFEPAEFQDPYEEELVKMLKRRTKGAEPIHEPVTEAEPTNVVNLMDALRQSLGGRERSSRSGSGGARGNAVVKLRKRSPPSGQSKRRSSGGQRKHGAR